MSASPPTKSTEDKPEPAARPKATTYRMQLHNWGQPKGIRPQYYDTPTGPIHRRKWETGVHLHSFESEQIGTGWGNSKDASRESAALSALRYLKLLDSQENQEGNSEA
ncbi:hypothetical protein BDV98DRAFT_608917 [Pterulicium gracile]|uniref:DRBM domain-containing protein n=1 Tax=Pterulicium gracile TaxID=1884261 RepID=A0A5C3Q036_9AGAR|nr:hypothetical protein BDV98DRAFT_608917 [Pterula gracilis]